MKQVQNKNERRLGIMRVPNHLLEDDGLFVNGVLDLGRLHDSLYFPTSAKIVAVNLYFYWDYDCAAVKIADPTLPLVALGAVIPEIRARFRPELDGSLVFLDWKLVGELGKD